MDDLTNIDISNNARVLLASSFMNPKASLTFGLVISRLTPEAEGAINELIAKGVLHRRNEPGGGLTLTLTEAGRIIDRRPPGDSSEEMWQFMADNNFALTVPNENRTSKPGNALKSVGVTSEQAQAAQKAKHQRKAK